jgi:tyrosine-protein phosphatase SIW14
MRFSCKRGCILAAVLLASFLVSPDRLPFEAPPAAAQRSVSLSGAVVLSAPPLAEHIPLRGVNNFGRVTGHLYRGAQPSSEGFTELKRLGVGIVVNLRDDHGEQEKEKRTVEALGLRYVPIPWNARHEPTDAQVAEFLDLVRANPQTRIFVHCHLGADRTGVMIAAYRIAEQAWTPPQAIAEMKAFHLHFWLPHLNRYIERFPRRLETSSDLRPLASLP